MITLVVVVIHNVYHWTPTSLHQLVRLMGELTCTELNMNLELTVIPTYVEVITYIYIHAVYIIIRMQCVYSYVRI